MNHYIGLCIVGFGVLLILISAFGCVKMRSTYMVMHSAGIAESCGAPIVLMGLIVMNGFNLISLKLAILIILIVLLSPTATHSLANAKFYKDGKKKL